MSKWASELNYSAPKSFLVDSARKQLIKPSKPLVRKINERLKDGDQ